MESDKVVVLALSFRAVYPPPPPFSPYSETLVLVMVFSIDEKEIQETLQSKEKTTAEVQEQLIGELHDTDSSPGTPVRSQHHRLKAQLENPLTFIPREQLLADAEEFAATHGLAEYTKTIQKGALVARDPTAFETLLELTEEDKRVLRREFTHKWDHPKTLYYMVIMCSIAAAVGGVRLVPSNVGTLI